MIAIFLLAALTVRKLAPPGMIELVPYGGYKADAGPLVRDRSACRAGIRFRGNPETVGPTGLLQFAVVALGVWQKSGLGDPFQRTY